MSIRYVVVVRLEDDLRVYGTYRERSRADDFVEKINTAVEKGEDAEFEEWRTQRNDDVYEMAPCGYGRAGVLIVHEPRIREGIRFAFTGSEAAA